MRSDLSEPQRRQVEWMRRSAAQKAGGMVESLVDAHIDPTEYLVELGELLREWDRRLESDLREAA